MKKSMGSQHQTGQAMIEYAILLTVMVTLIAGGVELGLAAFNSNRTAEAAKAGSTEWLKKGLNYALDDGVDKVIDRDGDNIGDSWGIGDHTSSEAFGAPFAGLGNFTNPVCDPVGGHSSGLPSDAAPEDERHPALDPADVGFDPARNRVYLYNPLPLDITGCPSASGVDFTTFVGGETFPSPPATREFTEYYLPPVNRALLSLYVKECVDNANQVIDCTSADPTGTDKVYLRLPGGPHIDPNLAGSPDPSAMTKLGIFTEDGTALDTTAGQEDLLGSPTGFLDTFRMHCRLPGGTFPSRLEEDNCKTLCYNDAAVDTDGDTVIVGDGYDDDGVALACDVRVTIRYRHIFESLVLMMQWKNSVNDADRQYTDSPFVNDLSPTDLSRGILGTEVTRGFVLKPQKTFLGCNETTSVINKTSTGGANSIEVRSCN